MSGLSPSLPFHPDETHVSWGKRLAAFHTRGSLLRFLEEMRIDRRAFLNGEPAEVRRLCRYAAEDPAPVLRNTVRVVGGRSRTIRTETFDLSLLSPRSWFCPLCLRDDETLGSSKDVVRRHRLAWLFEPVRSCHVHAVFLSVEPMSAPSHRVGVLDDHIDDMGPPDRALANDVGRIVPSSFQRYLLNRLEGVAGPEWLDAQSLDLAWKSTELLGAVVKYDPHRSLRIDGTAALEQASDAGWTTTSSGEAAVAKVVATLLDSACKGDANQFHSTTTFGVLNRWLQSRGRQPVPGPLYEIVRNAVMDRFPFRQNQRVYGRTEQTPKLMTVAAVASAVDRVASDASRLLIMHGLVPSCQKANNPSRQIVTGPAAMTICRRMHRTATFQEAIATLARSIEAFGIGWKTLETLMRSGFVGSTRQDRYKDRAGAPAVDTHDLRLLIGYIEGLPTASPEDHALVAVNAVPRMDANLGLAKALGCHPGKLFRSGERAHVNDILVDRVAIEERRSAPMRSMAVGVAFRLLEFPASIDPEAVHWSDRGGPLGKLDGFGRRSVEVWEMDWVRRTFVSLERLKIETGYPLEDLVSALEKSKTLPVFDPDDVGLILYRRSDLISDMAR